MAYIEIRCQVSEPTEGNEILIALLSELGCDSFEENAHGLNAYISQENFDKQNFDNLLQQASNFSFDFSFTYHQMEDKNWNALWEQSYQPVLIDNQCYIRAPFHEPIQNIGYDIIIKPEMSFGTAHHPTTAQLVSYLLREDCVDKKVLDMGTGTGVLAILAKKRGAKYVLAIDNDKWAYHNCMENIKRNDCQNVIALYGDVALVKDTDFDIVIANINRNILLRDMKFYAQAMKKNAVLFLSGFFLNPDLNLLKEEAEKYGLVYDSHCEKNEWVAARLVKKCI